MAHSTYQSEPVFRKTLDWCSETLSELGFGKSLLALLYGDDAGLLDETVYSQPAVFSIGFSLAELWKAEGVEPAAVMGHSVGEYVAAVVAGVMSPRDGLRLVMERAKLMQAAPKKDGVMVAVRASEEQARAAIKAVLGSEVDDDADCPCGCLQNDIFLVGTTQAPAKQQERKGSRTNLMGKQRPKAVCVIAAVNGPRSVGKSPFPTSLLWQNVPVYLMPKHNPSFPLAPPNKSTLRNKINCRRGGQGARCRQSAARCVACISLIAHGAGRPRLRQSA